MTTLNSDSIVVVCAADDGYAMPLAVTIRSAFENLKGNRKIALFIIDGGISKRNKLKIMKSLNSEKCDIKWLPRPDALLGKIEVFRNFTVNFGSFGNVSEPQHITIAAYYRLLIPELLPRQFEKAIYLDSDLTVIGDLGQLWDIDMGENYLLAVQDTMTPYVSSPCGLINYRELGLPPDYKYFHSGVLVIDLEKWRSNSISAKTVEYLKQNREYVRWHDGDVLNAVLAGKWGELDPGWNHIPVKDSPLRWNYSLLSDDDNHLVHNPYIIHFATVAKPWNSREKHPARDLFFQYLDMTAWSGWRFTIWRRLWRRLGREMKQLRSLVSLQKTVCSRS